MPQGRRKQPFSGKAKKHQLQAKKQRQNPTLLTGGHSKDDDERSNDVNEMVYECNIQKINKQPKDNNSTRNRYTLQFFQESKQELIKRKELARSTIEPLPLEQQEVSDDYFPPGVDMPKRPPWDYNMSKQQLELREQAYFTEYLKDMHKLSSISYFELNLETWRQLWRVLEMSDVLLLIVDIRYPVCMFPPYLYNHVVNECQKDMILVLNKVDLAPPALVVAWLNYFETMYPKLRVVMFTSYPSYNLRGNTNETDGIKKRRRRGKLQMPSEGAGILLDTCKEIVGDKVDLSSWQTKIHEDRATPFDMLDIAKPENVIIEKADTSFFQHQRYKNGVLTIGCIGTPNVGKSSLMNALMGRKVVSVSHTPGHTKHFQTIFLTKTVCLCDCPGLVFPSTVPKQLQILMGSFPIAQVREPYTTVKFLAERLDMPKVLALKHPENDDTWSARDICDAWAAKRNFVTARTARFDTYRAANSLLRMALEGKLCIYLYPPGWAANKDEWETYQDIQTVRYVQAKDTEDNLGDSDLARYKTIESSSEDEEYEENERETRPSQKPSKDDESNSDSDDETSEESEIPAVVNKFAALSGKV